MSNTYQGEISSSLSMGTRSLETHGSQSVQKGMHKDTRQCRHESNLIINGANPRASMATGARSQILLGIAFLLPNLPWLSYSVTNTLLQGQQLKFGDQLFSSSNLFGLGFRTFGDAKDNYLTIFQNLQEGGREPVWVANRENPILDYSAALTIDRIGSLKIVYDRNDSFVLYLGEGERNTSAILLDTGNLILRELNSDGSVKQDLWQSFENPSNTLLAGMKLGHNYQTEISSSLTSWGGSVPTLGSFTFGLDPKGINQLVILLREEIYWTSGRLKDGHFNSSSLFSQTFDNMFNYISDGTGAYFGFLESVGGNAPMLMIDVWGRLWLFRSGKMDLVVSCLSSLSSPSTLSLSEGCSQTVLPDCRSSTDKFWPKMGVMSGHGFKFMRSDNRTIYDCQAYCLNNCSCIAFASKTGSDCEIWGKEASFINRATADGGREIYVLSLAPEVNRWWLWLLLGVGGGLLAPLLCSFGYISLDVIKRKWKSKRKQKKLLHEIVRDAMFSLTKYKRHRKTAHDLQIFSFECIVAATGKFSVANKLGQGGYGSVYKGILFAGQEIAVKRLSRASGQGLAEFKNEATVIAKLQHTNLVRLLGFCIQEEEKMIIYEYMPNKSLDFFLFDSTRRKQLNWDKRFSIIEGIVQGLVYLHKYSRLKVIHRDLKASNILLDNDMNPKISDFGMARILGLKESALSTKRVVGTLGYMPPEYAFQGIVSTKTDVFSFGVLLLEIVSGMRNSNCHISDKQLNLIGAAWKLWKEGRCSELIDPTLMAGSYQANEILRCIHVGLLCVQDQASDRPTMTDVVSMFSKETAKLCPPKQPAFFIRDTVVEMAEVAENKLERCSTNYLTISVVDAR